MKNICTAIAALAEVRELSDGLCKAGASIAVSGLAPVHRAMLAAALLEREERPLAVICADDAEAARFAADLTLKNFWIPGAPSRQTRLMYSLRNSSGSCAGSQ